MLRGIYVCMYVHKYTYYDKQYKGPLTAVPMVSLTVLPNFPNFIDNFYVYDVTV